MLSAASSALVASARPAFRVSRNSAARTARRAPRAFSASGEAFWDKMRVGYTGGDSENPTYGTVCGGDGHTEAVKIEFDPNVISYEQLLDTFWAEHNPSGYKPKVQYKSAIWPQNEAQEAAARASKKAIEDKYNKTLHTDIEPPKTWYDAEEYHQDYIKKQTRRGW